MQQSLFTYTKVVFKTWARWPLQRRWISVEGGQVVIYLPLPGLLLFFAADISHRLLLPLPLSALTPTSHLSLLAPMTPLFPDTAVGVGGPWRLSMATCGDREGSTSTWAIVYSHSFLYYRRKRNFSNSAIGTKVRECIYTYTPYVHWSGDSWQTYKIYRQHILSLWSLSTNCLHSKRLTTTTAAVGSGTSLAGRGGWPLFHLPLLACVQEGSCFRHVLLAASTHAHTERARSHWQRHNVKPLQK